MKVINLITVLISTYSFCQVGINTELPKSTLDVEGEVVLRNSLRVGGTDKTKGDAGLKDQILISQGEGLPPTWRYTNIPFIENGQYKLINTYVIDDQIGIKSMNDSDGKYLSSIGDPLDSSWKKIDALKTEIEIKSDKNKTTYQFQTGVEAVTDVAPGEVKFLCGIFKDSKLVALRPDKITTQSINAPIQYIYTLNYTDDNLDKRKYMIEVACRRIEGSNHRLAIGTNTEGSHVSNAFMLKSFIKIDLAEFVTFKIE
ncbi:hypothetical protein [Empedobacter brevis]|uniref:hypothetical protein n=1 Tax=Empedobacter brevis TaxID=247 RepID=UPI0039B104B1